MYNKSILVGRLVADPELRNVGESKVTNFRIAVDRPYVAKDGNRPTDFFTVTAWNRLAEVVAENLTKGRLVLVEGRMEVRNFEHNGQQRSVTELNANEVKFLDSAKNSSSASPAPTQETVTDSDIPF